MSGEASPGSIAARAPQTITVLEPPGKDLRPSIGPGRPVLISGRFLTPAGRTALTQSYSWGMAISADESTAVLLSRGSHPGDIMQGLFQVIDVPDAAQLADYTRQVVANTYRKRQVTDDGRNPLPPAPRLRPSPIRHIVFIVKENRTFDQVFGDRKNVAGDPTLAGLGCHAAVVFPDDYNEAGALWEHLDRHRIRFFNFGFGTEMPASIEQQIHKYTGMQIRVSIPLPKPLLDNTSRKFATFNMHIPDQFRIDMFEEEYREKWASGRERFPRLITMVLPNDHLASVSPATGYPFKESYMADNDLALARVVRFLSRTPTGRAC